MTNVKHLTTTPLHPRSLGKRMFIGAAIALIPISLFLATAQHTDPDWPSYWMLRPLLTVPFAGAMGGLFYYLMESFSNQRNWNKLWVYITSLMVYIIGVFMGIVLGLDGTFWN